MKYYISTIEDSEVKAYCVMSDDGFVMACESTRDDEKFFAEVEKAKEYYNCIEIVEPTLTEQEQSNRNYSKIPHISTSIGNFFKTEKGKKMILDYVKEQDAFDYGLLDELINLPRKKNKTDEII